MSESFEKNQLLRQDGAVIRILARSEDKCLIIDCLKRRMPQWIPTDALCGWETCTQAELLPVCTAKGLTAEQQKTVHERYTLIAPILPFIQDEGRRSEMIAHMAKLNRISKQTVRKYLCTYLAYQQTEALAPAQCQKEKPLSTDEKNFRWALNKFYYTRRQHSLATAYSLMLKEKYTDACGQLMDGYPPFHRFKYFYRKTFKTQTSLISRNGKCSYQRNSRPLLGTVRDFAPSVGVGMLDGTVCDIYLVNDAGQLVGRPILTLCVDACTSLICGYHLSWEGGIYSLQQLMHNVVCDKVDWCRRHGIVISPEQWPVSGVIPGILVTDKGKEYVGSTFEQLTELGVRMVNLPPYRPELKGIVEHAFALIQGCYKPHLKDKGVIEPDFRERSGPDYRKDACLTIENFEKIVIHCILYCNNHRIIGEQALCEDMVNADVKPTANSVWQWSCTQDGANLIPVDAQRLRMTLLPRAEGRFTRRGLMVLKQRYRHCEGKFTEQYLRGGSVAVAYDPDDISAVWLVEGGLYTRFEIILKIYDNLSLEEVVQLQSRQQTIRKSIIPQKDRALVDLATSIEVITGSRSRKTDVKLEDIRQTHKTEKQRRRGGAKQ